MGFMEDQGPGSPQTALVTALTRLLRPLVRLLIGQGVTYPMLSGILKSIYVQVGEAEFPIAGKAQTDSRITLLTGVHRKDVKRLRGRQQPLDSLPERVSLGAQLVVVWTTDPRFLTDGGKPRDLERLPGATGTPCFEDLVRTINKDIRPRAVLDEWLRLGVVTAVDDDRVHLHTDAFVPEEGFDEKAHYFGQNLRDHIAAGVANLSGHHPPFFDRSVFSDGLDASSAAVLESTAKENAMRLLLDISKQAVALEDNNLDKSERERVNVGVYIYREKFDASSQQETGDEKPR